MLEVEFGETNDQDSDEGEGHGGAAPAAAAAAPAAPEPEQPELAVPKAPPGLPRPPPWREAPPQAIVVDDDMGGEDFHLGCYV